MTRTERLERQSERSRARVADLIDELRERVVPSEMVDQFMDLSSNGVALDFVRSLGQQVRRNPIPCALIGAGLVWLMFSERNGHAAPPAQRARGQGRAAQRRNGSRRKRGRRRQAPA
jgi:hypothetical protein